MHAPATTRRALCSLGLFASGYGFAYFGLAGTHFFRKPIASNFIGVDNFVVDVRNFGAVGNGVADDASAINKAIDHLRSVTVDIGSFLIAPTLRFSPGVYAIGKSINLTKIRAISTLIDGSGAVILARCGGQPAIDAIGSRWLSFQNLTIIGNRKYSPTVGIQIGRTCADEIADDHGFENVRVVGNFSLASLYNRGAETSSFIHCLFWNDMPNSHCLIQDGVNHFNLASEFTKCSFAQDKSVSFNENIFVNCDFRHGASGVPVWLGDTSRLSLDRCYAATDGASAFILFSGEVGHTDLQIDCHCETGKLDTIFSVRSSNKKVTLAGISFRDHLCFARNSIFQAEKLDEIEVENVDIDIARFRSRSCKLLVGAPRWHAYGKVKTLDWPAIADESRFSGEIEQGKAGVRVK